MSEPDVEFELARWLQAEHLPAIHLDLLSGREVDIRRLLRREVRSVAPIDRSANCWAPNKPALDFAGTATWAELVIVQLLEHHGWSGRWIKNWVGGREFCRRVGRPEPLPDAAAEVFSAVDRKAASATGGGAWDVFAWRGTDYLFIESKQHRSSDRLRPGQLAWLDAGLAVGIEPSHFVVVEYDAPQILQSPMTQNEANGRGSRTRRLAGAGARGRPGDRILLRDPIAAHGELAIEAMVDWLGDTRLRPSQSGCWSASGARSTNDQP